MNKFILFFLLSCAYSRNVPVFIWGSTPQTLKYPPALSYTPHHEFRNNLSLISDETFLVLFVEDSLSIEDLTMNKPHLNFLSSQNFTYIPNVENPIKAAFDIKNEIHEMSDDQAAIIDYPSITANATVIYLNSTAASRLEMLIRHDAFLNQTYAKILEHYKNVVAIYTGTQRTEGRIRAINLSPNTYFTPHIMLQVAPEGTLKFDNSDISFSNFRVYSHLNKTGLFVSIANSECHIEFFISIGETHWIIESIRTYTDGMSVTFDEQISIDHNYAYGCQEAIFKSEGYSLKLYGLRLEVVNAENNMTDTKVQDCVGYVTIPILVGLLVSALLLLFLGIGIYMLSIIQTGDRFNDQSHYLHADTIEY